MLKNNRTKLDTRNREHMLMEDNQFHPRPRTTLRMLFRSEDAAIALEQAREWERTEARAIKNKENTKVYEQHECSVKSSVVSSETCAIKNKGKGKPEDVDGALGKENIKVYEQPSSSVKRSMVSSETSSPSYGSANSQFEFEV